MEYFREGKTYLSPVIVILSVSSIFCQLLSADKSSMVLDFIGSQYLIAMQGNVSRYTCGIFSLT